MNVQAWLNDPKTIKKSRKMYAHFDYRVDIKKAAEFIQNPDNIASYGFYPFIHYTMKMEKYNMMINQRLTLIVKIGRNIEKKKSPFFHFGQLMNLDKIPYNDFKCYLYERLNFLERVDEICDEILAFTQCHPYYTQQLASQVWEIGKQGVEKDDVVKSAIVRLLEFHDLNFERIWLNFNNTDKRILQWLANGNKPYTLMGVAQSTISSSLKRMLRDGYLIKPAEYELEDPFFRNWILQQ